MRGIMLSADNDLEINVQRDSNGLITSGLVIGERKIQDAYVVLNINQGELKEDPIAGANLLRYIRGKEDRFKIKTVIETSLRRVGVELDDIKQEIVVLINKQNIAL
jgi:hypothetical protein